MPFKSNKIIAKNIAKAKAKPKVKAKAKANASSTPSTAAAATASTTASTATTDAAAASSLPTCPLPTNAEAVGICEACGKVIWSRDDFKECSICREDLCNQCSVVMMFYNEIGIVCMRCFRPGVAACLDCDKRGQFKDMMKCNNCKKVFCTDHGNNVDARMCWCEYCTTLFNDDEPDEGSSSD